MGDDEDAVSYQIYGKLRYSGSLVDNGTRTQTRLVGPVGDWVLPPSLLQDDDGTSAFSEAFNQISSSQVIAQPATNLPGRFRR